MRQIILDVLLDYRFRLPDGEFISASSSEILADRIEQALLNKFTEPTDLVGVFSGQDNNIERILDYQDGID